MPLFSVDSEKEYQGETWTNRYIVNAASLAAAATVGGLIVARERAIHRAQVLFTRYRTSDNTPNTDVYQISQINATGNVVAATDMLPLFCVLRIDFTTIGGGRPSRKYLRLPIDEGEVTNGLFTGTTMTRFVTDYVNGMIAIPEYVDVDGQAFSFGTVHPRVAMRQLRRGSKRKLVPVLG